MRELTHVGGILVSLYGSERFLLGEEQFSKLTLLLFSSYEFFVHSTHILKSEIF